MAISGREIRRIRAAMGLTQVEFAALLGTIGNTVAKWEREEATPREPTAKLIQLLGAQPTLLDGIRQQKQTTKAAKKR
jgi:DNA-binding transcriptional regulator YiaG